MLRYFLIFFIVASSLFANEEKKEEVLNQNEEKQVEQKQDSFKLELDKLKLEIKDLKKFKEKQELDSIRREASEIKEKKDDFDTSKVYSGGQTAQQALNPEISVVTDMGFKVNVPDLTDENKRSGAYFRVAAFHIQSDLDPFSKTFLGIEVHPEGIGLGEAFIDWNGIIPSLTIRVGKFLENFGVINRWHMPSLDQFDNPLPAGVLLGGKLNSYGVSLHWIMPALWASSNELFLEITNSQNPTLFTGEYFSAIPSTLLRVLSYYDLSDSSYLSFGLSGVVGPNNISNGLDGEGNPLDEDNRFTFVGGADLTFLYEPSKTASTESFLWRTEFYYVNKDLGSDVIKAYGAYSYMQGKITDRLSIGTRFDFTQPLELDNSDKYIYQVVPYITFMQSPWVKMRLQYNYKNGTDTEMDNRLTLQLIWAAGPHKHERY